MKNKTFVKFLVNKNDNEVFAYFPYLIYSSDKSIKTCYSQMGQHSSCSVDYALECRYAKPAEYFDLKRELETVGYYLKISKGNQ